MHNQITHFVESIPQYIGEAVVGFIALIFAGLILAYFSSKYFSRISEVTRVKGILFEKKLPIYKSIFSQLDNMNQLRMYKHETVEILIKEIKDAGLDFSEKPTYAIADFFTDYKKLQKTLLKLDAYISENRIYYDDEVYKQLLIFQNYINPYLHFYAIYENAVKQYIEDETRIEKVAQVLYTALGLVLTDDFAEQIIKVQNTIRKSLNQVELEFRKMPTYDYAYYKDREGFVMSNLKDSIVFTKNEEIQMLITTFAAIALLNKNESFII